MNLPGNEIKVEIERGKETKSFTLKLSKHSKKPETRRFL
jgi:hypothetical protein